MATSRFALQTTLFTLVCGLSVSAFATEPTFPTAGDESYLLLDGMKTDGTEKVAPRTSEPIPATLTANPGERWVAVAERSIKIGKDVITLVNGAAAVAEGPDSDRSVSVVPEEADPIRDMQGWQAGRSPVYKIEWKNIFGHRNVALEYQITYFYGASFRGNGRYLRDVAVNIIRNESNMYGVQMKVDVQTGNPILLEAANDPTAAVQLKVRYNMKSAIMQQQSGTHTYLVRGDGDIVAQQQ